MTYDFKIFRITDDSPPYPPYHTGFYLEEYFFDFYNKNKLLFDNTGYTLIPIFWTAVYRENIFFKSELDRKQFLQQYLDALPSGNYFCVSQHDDAVKEYLPKKTLSFEAGGRRDGIPIPLICSSLKYIPKNLNKEFFCSFIGSYTHPLRKEIFNLYSSDKDFKLNGGEWAAAVTDKQFNEFITTTVKSEFTLCPRGYGASSFRLYEALQLGSIPVYISDKKWLPFEDEINWNDFCVIVEPDNLINLKNILKDISDNQKNKMILKGKEIYNNYFTLEKTCAQILKMLEKRKI
jgi:hypothetical protein